MKLKIEEKNSTGAPPEIRCNAIKSGMVFYLAEQRGVKYRGMRLLALTDAYYNWRGGYDVVVLWLEGHPAKEKTAHNLYDVVQFSSSEKNRVPEDKAWILGMVDNVEVKVGKMGAYHEGRE